MSDAEKKPIRVYLGGCFDVLHSGHINILKRARSLGDELIVGVLTDEAMEAYKPPPVMPFAERIRIIQGLRWVDCAVPQEDTDATYLLAQIHPDILVHGDDHTPSWQIGQAWMEAHGKQFILLPYTNGVSSSSIKQRIADRASAPPLLDVQS